MQYVTGRRNVTRRRKRIATAFGIGAGGGVAAGLSSFGLRRGLSHYRRLRSISKVRSAPKVIAKAKGFGRISGGIRRMGGHIFRSFARMPL